MQARYVFRSHTRLVAVVIPLVCLAWMVPTAAFASVPGLERVVTMSAREQPVRHFIEELFGQVGVPVRVDERIDGYVNGSFAKSAQAVCDDVLGSFQLSVYYDGAVAHVYRSGDVGRSILPLDAAGQARLVTAAEELGLPDEHNTLRPSTTGGLIVSGAQRFVEQIEELSHAVVASAPRAAAPRDTYRVFRLRYAWADDVSVSVGGRELVVPGIASILRSVIEPGMTAPPARPDEAMDQSLDGLRGEGLGATGAADSLHAEAGGSADIESTRIVADARLNAIIVRDSADRMPMYDALIASLDVEPVMLEIEATIIDMDTDRLRELGINWRLEDGDDVAAVVGGSDDIEQAAEATNGLAGGIVSLVVGDETRFLSRMRALETQGAARIVSKPHVITLSDVEAILDTTSTFFVRVAGQEEVDLFDVSVGTTLRVTPHVFDAAGGTRIKLLVNIEDGSASDRRVDAIPVVERSTINTQALIDGDESLLVGGLVREFTENRVSKVPLLGDVPGLGALFRSHGKSSNRVERLFLITPRLVRRPGEVREFGVPPLHGDEAELIASAHRRLDAPTVALAERELDRPLAPALPSGSQDVSLLTDRALDAAASHRARERAIEAVPSLRERLLGLQAPEAPPTLRATEQLGDARRVDPLEVDSNLRSDEWIAVPEAVLPAPVERSTRVDAPGDDDWQEVRG